MALIDLKVPDRNNPRKTVTLKRYVIDDREEPTAIIFGKFSPWTGPKGHGLLVDFAKKQKFKNILIVSPLREKVERKGKSDANIFTPEQRGMIIEKATGENFKNVKSSIPIRMFTELLNMGISRPVFIVGGDRGKDFRKIFVDYKKSNKGITDPKDKDFGKGEMLFIPRTKSDTSATKVRKALVDGDVNEFLKLTGYKQDMWNFLRRILKQNKIIESANHWM